MQWDESSQLVIRKGKITNIRLAEDMESSK
jgi:hypothetical protein